MGFILSDPSSARSTVACGWGGVLSREGGAAGAPLPCAHPACAPLPQKHTEPDAPSSANESFFSVESTGSQAGQETVKTRLRSATSVRSLASLPSQESLARLGSSSPNDAASNATLMSLPGYRPATRSSMRHSQASTGGECCGQGRLRRVGQAAPQGPWPFGPQGPEMVGWQEACRRPARLVRRNGVSTTGDASIRFWC